MEDHFHDPVLKEPLLELLKPQAGGTYIDANLGGGSHSLAILETLGENGKVYGIDLDPCALATAAHRLRAHRGFVPVRGNFRDLETLLAAHGVSAVDGVIFDLGVSSYQLDTAERGFSFRHDGPLDMRMDPTQGTSAAEVVHSASESELARIIREYGEERWAGPIARKIVQQRRHGAIGSTLALAGLVAAAIPRHLHPPRTHVATRTFQALRIHVNQELDSLAAGLRSAIGLLRPQGRIGCIAYHSLEDRIVKQTFQRLAGMRNERPQGLPLGFMPPAPPALLQIITRQPYLPSDAEVARNPRARSARLRVAEKLGEALRSPMGTATPPS